MQLPEQAVPEIVVKKPLPVLVSDKFKKPPIMPPSKPKKAPKKESPALATTTPNLADVAGPSARRPPTVTPVLVNKTNTPTSGKKITPITEIMAQIDAKSDLRMRSASPIDTTVPESPVSRGFLRVYWDFRF